MVAAAVIGAAAVGAVASSSASSKASGALKDSATLASQTELEQYRQNREDMQPWREQGLEALGQLGEGTASGGDFNRDFTMADFTKDPGYDFRMRQGEQAMERSAAARGGALSGGAVKGAVRYGQEFASGEFQNAYNRFNNDRTQRFNRLSSLAGTGQTATRDVAQQGAQTAANVGGYQTQAGNATAAGAIGTGNAINSAAGTLGNWAMQREYMPKNPGGYTPPAQTGWAENTGGMAYSPDATYG